ncbi:hypothetical protein [Altibacter sp.]|uniref:DUF1328 domain-containing protein n=1 Tax=Altibacter sp. TaxID=2024823 RepID=UPI000C9888BB|nr:hypothetical protein [Altibacter sp.]MAP54173.1 hypothetical protein [Altibacter sp.]|tara:strand:- start:99 stop:311 length:213 start_codon:yes stop_codon:yes gene_type:complete
MKNYTTHFLIITLVSGVLGFTGLEYPGATFVRFICLVAAVGLMISCLDAVLISRKIKRIQLKEQREDVRK